MGQEKTSPSTYQTLKHLLGSKLLVDVNADTQIEAYLSRAGGVWVEILQRGKSARESDGITYGLGYYIGLVMARELKQAIAETLRRGLPEPKAAKQVFKLVLAYRKFVYPVLVGEMPHSVWGPTANYMKREDYLEDFPEIPPKIVIRIRKLSRVAIGTYQNKNQEVLRLFSSVIDKRKAQVHRPKRMNLLQALERVGL